ncbi:putative tetratricopeptide repeat domain 1 [Operophtera brumata]|uniref:Putative tetratricopeptide repeat domain 1 n=1 Tax=Operophtera brumata TaxID=104452 RepID=A0A0L7KY21_OPEBR|nr:putative tetratricopeptide repeat domain 1 [Operophtera brumata]
MSERLKNTTQVSNEDVIDDLTKDLQSSLNTAENLAEFVISPETSAENMPTDSGDAAPFTGKRAQSYEASEKFDESLADYKKILELDPSHQEARKASLRLPPLIEAKNEKLKEEMLGKLKDLGNMILKPFGLSTNNFQMDQDPDTKGYKINFKQ